MDQLERTPLYIFLQGLIWCQARSKSCLLLRLLATQVALMTMLVLRCANFPPGEQLAHHQGSEQLCGTRCAIDQRIHRCTGPDGGDAEYYVNTARFYSQIRSLRIDITSTDPNAYVCAIHY
jgi:hypothetical protein